MPATPKRKRAYLIAGIAVAIAGLIISLAIGYGSRKTATLTTIEVSEHFLNLSQWTTPNSGWTIPERGFLQIEDQQEVGFLPEIKFADFTVAFDFKLNDPAGAAWALRVQDSKNYYLFNLSGPGSKYPKRFLAYVVRDGKFDIDKPQADVPFPLSLAKDVYYHINIKAEQNRIIQTITPSDSSVEEEIGTQWKLGEFIDQGNIFPTGSIGFRTVGPQSFRVSEIYVRPLQLETPGKPAGDENPP